MNLNSELLKAWWASHARSAPGELLAIVLVLTFDGLCLSLVLDSVGNMPVNLEHEPGVALYCVAVLVSVLLLINGLLLQFLTRNATAKHFFAKYQVLERGLQHCRQLDLSASQRQRLERCEIVYDRITEALRQGLHRAAALQGGAVEEGIEHLRVILASEK